MQKPTVPVSLRHAPIADVPRVTQRRDLPCTTRSNHNYRRRSDCRTSGCGQLLVCPGSTGKPAAPPLQPPSGGHPFTGQSLEP